jgi:hypothetical protein
VILLYSGPLVGVANALTIDDRSALRAAEKTFHPI